MTDTNDRSNDRGKRRHGRGRGPVERPDGYCEIVRDIIIRVGATCPYCLTLYALIDVDTGGPESRTKRRHITVAKLAALLGFDAEVVGRHVRDDLEAWGLVTVERPGATASPRVRVAYNPARGIKGWTDLPGAPPRPKRSGKKTAEEIDQMKRSGRGLTPEQRDETRHAERGEGGRYAPNPRTDEWIKRRGKDASKDTETVSKEEQR